MSTTVSYRRSQFLNARPPEKGAVIYSRTGKMVLEVLKVVVWKKGSEPPERDMIRMEVEQIPPPVDKEPGPWPIDYTRVVTPLPADRQAALAKATAAATPSPRTRKQKRRAAMLAGRVAAMLGDNEVVPKAQREPTLGRDREVVLPAKAVAASWRDPEDTNVRTRLPKMVSGGFRRYDPVDMLARNGTIKPEHKVAAGLYRDLWERGPGGAMPGGRELVYSEHQYTPSMGPSEFKCDAITMWGQVQADLSPIVKTCLAEVVLEGTAVSVWADKRHIPRTMATGMIIAALDQLALIFADQVHYHLRTEHVDL